MAEPTITIKIDKNQMREAFEDCWEMVDLHARRAERAHIIRLLQSEDGKNAVSAGGLATSLLVPRLVKLIEQGAWKDDSV